MADAAICRLYRPEWVVVYSHTVGLGATTGTPRQRAEEHFDRRYLGRIRPEDVNYVSTGTGETAMCQILLRLPTMKGEFKHAHLATRHAESRGWDDYTIVARNSPEDHELRGYGVVKLAQL